MARALTTAIQGLITTEADRLLLGSVAIALFFGITLYVVASFDCVLFIEGGVGFFQNYGLFTAIVGDAILFFLTKKFHQCVTSMAESNVGGQNLKVLNIVRDLNRSLSLLNKNRFILYAFMLFGLLFVSSNVAQHVFGQPDVHWRGDVFDSLRHPASFTMNKLFLLYSWCIVIPLCAFIFLITSVYMSRIFIALSFDENSKYDLLNPDNAGGYSAARYASAYLNIALSIVYLQISLYVLTFQGANPEHIIGYAIATLLLLFANAIVFRKVETVIAKKKDSALNDLKSKTYSGDQLHFDIYRYYVDIFSKHALQRRLSVLVFSVKSVVIVIPPIVNGYAKLVLG